MAEKIRDLVCGMEFDEDTASGEFEHKGKIYYFCSLGCKDKFMKDANKYVEGEEKRN